MFETNAPLLVLPMAEYHKRVLTCIGNCITDWVINSSDVSDFEHASQLGKQFAVPLKPEGKCSHTNSKEGL